MTSQSGTKGKTLGIPGDLCRTFDRRKCGTAQRPCKEAAKRGKALPYRAGAQAKWRPTLQRSKKISSLKVRKYACAVKNRPLLPPSPEAKLGGFVLIAGAR